MANLIIGYIGLGITALLASSLSIPSTRSPLDDQRQRQVEARKGLDLEIALHERDIPVPNRDQVIGEARLVCANMAIGDASRDQTAGMVRVDPEHQREFVDIAIEVWCPELGWPLNQIAVSKGPLAVRVIPSR